MNGFEKVFTHGRLRGSCPSCGSKKLGHTSGHIFCDECNWYIKKEDCKVEAKNTLFKFRTIFTIPTIIEGEKE